ncbi:hypothetical protein K413DRAFT_3030 [Clostridium sp. ASBs410]|nr:hypothetical protein K413DRAFT_3030 [Clostridium sp. ASBs410]
MVEKLIDFVTGNLIACIMVILGLITPGVLTIGIFNKELFLQLEFLKLIILAGSISVPTAVFFHTTLMFALGNEGETIFDIGGNYVVAALIINMIVFSVALLIKVFYRDTTLEEFILILMFFCIISSILMYFEKRDRKNVKKNM